MIARVMCVLLLVAGTAHAAGWTVTPPSGWTEDAAAGATMREQVKAGFFQPERVDVEGTIYRAADPKSKLVVQVVHANLDDETPTQAVERWTKRLAATAPLRMRADGGDAIADLEIEAEGYPVHMSVRARRDAGLMHMLVVACSEPPGQTSCAPVLASVRVADEPPPPAHKPWTQWLAMAGALLLVVGFVGWRVELRRRAR